MEIKSLLAALSMSALLAGCCTDKVDVTSEVINPGYVGNGIEWDPYDEAASWGCQISDEDWQKIFDRLDYMKPQYVRCMINSRYVYYDAGTGKYDRDLSSGNLIKLLTYCQENDIMVIYGEYNPPTWEMKDSPEWVRMSVDFLNYLVTEKGFDCIKHFIIFNEPDGNWASTNGDYALWSSMAKLFISEMQKYPELSSKVDLAGPDAVLGYTNSASEYDYAGWVRQSAADFDANIGIYDVHAYPGQFYVRSGKFAEDVKALKAVVPEGKKILFGEAGYKYYDVQDSLLMKEYRRRAEGHPFTKGSDCNMLVYDFFYALDMPLFLIETMNNGFSGAAAWMLDDAMHSNNDSGKPEDIKLWGMWNILGEEVFGDASQEDVRPWYYTWSLMSRYFPAGCDILKVSPDTEYEGLHYAAAVKDGKYTLAILNLSSEDRHSKYVFPAELEGASVYVFAEDGVEYDENGHLVPVMTGISSDSFDLNVPAESFVLVTNI